MRTDIETAIKILGIALMIGATVYNIVTHGIPTY